MVASVFQTEMVETVTRDFQAAKEHMQSVHRQWDSATEAYYASYAYRNIRQHNNFPMPLMQELADQFVAHLSDKLFFKDKPCTVVGVEKTDREDAQAKQDMLRWQDYKDDIPGKTEQFLRDAFLYGIAVAQVDYAEDTRKALQVQTNTTLEGITEETYEYTDQVTYKGPKVNYVDPYSFFVGPDKKYINDEFPIMIRTDQTREFFFSQPYFFNQKELPIDRPGTTANRTDEYKSAMLGRQNTTNQSEQTHEYVEWQGLVQRKKAFRFLKREMPQDSNEHDWVWCIVGVVDGRTMVRFDTMPLSPHTDADGPNVIVGTCMKTDNFIGDAIAQKVLPMHLGSEQVMGMLMENLKQSVNAMFVMNKRHLSGEKQLVNKAGAIIFTNDDISKAVKRIEQPQIADDFYKLIALFRQWAQDASGLQDNTLGKADAAVETLGEANMIATQASLRMRKYLKAFEDSFIRPLYAMRNQVNVDFLDQEYVYGIIGESTVNWRTIEPTQIRAPVDFICEASTREANRAVQTQQMLEMIQLAPASMQIGQPVRIDRMMADLAQVGFSMKAEDVENYFPLIAAEKHGNLNVDRMYVEMAMMNLGAMGNPNPPPPGQELPQPTTETQAITQVNRKQGVA